MVEPARTIKRIALIGARGYVGAELIRLIARHRSFKLVLAGSRQHAGIAVRKIVEGVDIDVPFSDVEPAALARRDDIDVTVLALPNGMAADYVTAIDAAGRSDMIIIDLSADHRFDDSWVYGLTEHHREAIRQSTRISNPGCYATTMQLILLPLREHLADVPPFMFGVSGYSGAGTSPSAKNDPEQLRDNLMPYALTDHLHEREVSRQMKSLVRFVPHVAPFFRGISMTAGLITKHALTGDDLSGLYETAYAHEPLIRLSPKRIPSVRDIAGHQGAEVGGWSVSQHDGTQVTVIATLDNLLKGAATQALQNINLAAGFEELEGIVIQ